LGTSGNIGEISFLIDEGHLVLGDDVVIEENVVLCKAFSDRTIERVSIGNGCVLRSGCVIYSGCRFGENVRIGHNTILMANTIIGKGTYIGGLVNCEGETRIGEYCGINAQSHITKYTEIGDYVFWGPMVCTTNDYRIKYHREGHGTGLIGPKFGRGVRVGNMATVLPGIRVGKNALIGAASVVTRDVPDNAIVYGAPARIKGKVPESDRI
jgi:UDP-2-acetamido-3-amino-2,3-dideoxy-glucuronate N-acetyltransferase